MQNDSVARAHRAYALGLVAMQIRELPCTVDEVNPLTGTLVFTSTHGGNKYRLTLEPVDVLADNEPPLPNMDDLEPSAFLG